MTITLTDVAAQRVKSFLASNAQAVGLRFGVTRTGCSGYAYVVDLADKISDEDTVFECDGIKVVVDLWRAAHPRVVQRWWDIQDAAIQAVARKLAAQLRRKDPLAGRVKLGRMRYGACMLEGIWKGLVR